MGDYTYVSAVPGRVWAVWGDARDIVPGVPSIFLPFFTCDFSAGFPPFNEACFSQGGLDWNIYGRQLE